MLQNALNPVENPHLLDMHNVSHKARSLMYNENMLYFRKFLLSSLFLVHFLFLGWFFYAEAQSSLQPDLTVTNATLTSTNLSFTVNNIGTAPTGLYHTRIEWIRADGTSATAPTYTEYGQSTNLAAGASLPISVDFAPPVYLATPPADAVRLKITVDILSAVPESNEVNNVVEIVLITTETTGEALSEADESMIAEEIAEEAPLGEPGRYDPTVLPGNPLYFFRGVGREIRSFFTFNSEKKAELRLRFVSEKILEANKLSDQGKEQALAAHLKSYEKDIVKFQSLQQKLKEKNPQAAEKLTEKALDSQLKQQILIGKFERKATAETLDDIKAIRAKTIKHIGETMGSVTDQEKIGKITESALNANGSPFKSLRNLEVLKQVGENVPEQAKGAIRKAQENSLKRFKDQTEVLPDKHKELLVGYVENAGGDETAYIKVFDDLKRSGVDGGSTDVVSGANKKVFERLDLRLKEASAESPQNGKKLLQHLSTGEIDDLRALKDIEQNVPSSFSAGIKEIREEAGENFVKKFDAIKEPEKKEAFVAEIVSRYPDIKQIEVFNNIKTESPEDKKDIIVGLQSKLVDHIKLELESTGKNKEKREIVIQKTIGDQPEYLKTISRQNEKLGKKLTDELLTAQAKRVEKTIGTITEEAKLELFKKEVGEDPATQQLIQKYSPDFYQKIEAQKEEMRTTASIPPSSPIACPEGYSPVCGADGKTYTNICFADQAKAPIKHKGECGTGVFPASSSCRTDFKPVCGIDGKTYTNECILKLAGVPLKYLGECGLPQMAPEPSPVFSCSTNYMPVCGLDNKTYTNECLTSQSGVKVQYYGECKSAAPSPQTSVVCTQEYAPVCGYDNKTYSNACFAKSAGVGLRYLGECKTIISPILPQCGDSLDNDKDDYIDLKDIGCSDSQDNDETDVATASPPPAAAPIADTTVPSTPTNLTVTAVSTTQIDLSWTASIDNVAVAGYRVYRRGTDGVLVLAHTLTSPLTIKSDTNLTAGTKYCYKVAAYDAANNRSFQSSEICAVTK